MIGNIESGYLKLPCEFTQFSDIFDTQGLGNRGQCETNRSLFMIDNQYIRAVKLKYCTTNKSQKMYKVD